MPNLVNPDESDWDKIMNALSSVIGIASFDDLLATFGLVDMPMAQRYGILFGCLTFTLTVTAVICLLIFGGSFKRIAEQANDADATIPDAITAREGRPLILERLVDARERMMKENYPEKDTVFCKDGKCTNLTKMLLNVSPAFDKIKEVSNLIDEDEKVKAKKKGSSPNPKVDPGAEKKKQEIRKYIPDGYEENYVGAYRKCQDKPGGKTLSGLPEARFEAYARAYAGCGNYTTLSYRRSYARLYEAQACTTNGTFEKFTELFLSRPQDLYGRTVRLEPLDATRHLDNLYEITSGQPYQEDKAYNPNEVWGFRDYGPFKTKEEMEKSPVFNIKKNEASFAIVEIITDRIIGVVMLTNDDPSNLNVELELPIVKPSTDGTVEQIEACFLLLDRLFAHGYRRVQLTIDTLDVYGKKLPGRIGFTQEGMVPKHMVVKESNRDSNIYGLLNSDWDKGARAFMYKKLHGEATQKADAANNAKEGEIDFQQSVLKEQKENKEAEEKNKKW